MAKQQSTDIVPVSDFKIAKFDKAKLDRLIKANLGGDDFSFFDLPKVNLPTGGAQFWTVGGKPQETVTGVIVHQKHVRRYYERGLDEGGEEGPPDCTSWDLRVGVGKPGGDCKTCPLAQFGSARPRGEKESRGQACKKYDMLVIQTPDSVMQTVIPVPPTSLDRIKAYFIELLNDGLAYYEVVTRFRLEKETKGGFPTAVVVPELVSPLSEQDLELFMPLHQRYEAMLDEPTSPAA